jgi:D-arabinose 1-dehydrogenase-like Zn-dependent alcohol dehydrogenase
VSYPARTRALVMHSVRDPLRAEEVPLPQALEAGAAIVRIACTTVCGTDARLWAGAWPDFPLALPMIPGHEMVGHVVALGTSRSVDALGRPLAVGSRIVWSESVCGRCRACARPDGATVLCEQRGYGFLQRSDRPPYATGGFAEHCYVAAGCEALLVSDDVADSWAAAACCTGKTVVHAVRRAGGIEPGATVVVQGAGPLGLFATAYACRTGAGPVIVIDPEPERLERAGSWGAEATVGFDAFPTPEARVERVRQLTADRGADLVLDLAGGRSSVSEAIRMAGMRATVALVGISSGAGEPAPMDQVLARELRVTGALNGDVSDLAAALAFFKRAAPYVAWDNMFEAPLALDETTGLAALKRQTGRKPVLLS